MLIAAYSPRITPGDPEKNVRPIAEAMERAADRSAELLVLPELCLTGATCGDLFWQKLLQEGAERALAALTRESGRFPALTALVGAPLRYEGALYSCAAVLRGGQLLGAAPLQSADMRWFAAPPREGGQIATGGLPPAVFAGNLIVRCGELTVSPDFGSDVLALPALYAADAGSVERLDEMAAGVSAQGFACALACPGAGESAGDSVYTGYAAVAAEGRLLASAEGEMVFGEAAGASWRRAAPPPRRTVEDPRSPFFPYGAADSDRRCGRILELQTAALAARLERTGSQKAVVGVSGGLDSALALLVSAGALEKRGLPARNLVAVTMPCFGTTARTRSNAELLSRALDCDFREIPVGESVALHLREIGRDSGVHDVVYENAQARERTQVLMDLANGERGLVVGTGDLSELALGWCTYNGDHMSMYAVNAGVPKTAVRRVVSWYAESRADGGLRAVLRDILATPVSPELLPPRDGAISQATEELLGPYELHDFFLARFLALGETPRELLDAAAAAFAADYDRETVKKWLEVFLRRFFTQQFKRSCSPEGPAVLGLSLAPRGGWRMSSDLSPEPWLRDADT